MAQNFIGCDREQPFLLPPDVREWLPEEHLAWFVIDAVGVMESWSSSGDAGSPIVHHFRESNSAPPEGR